MMQNPYSLSTEDPDYLPTNQENRRENVNQSLLEQDAKEQSIQKIKSIIHKQFSLEVHLKEREIELIDQRIGQTRAMLDRLRACVLARYYGTCTKPEQRSDSMSSGKRTSKRRCVETITNTHKNASMGMSSNTRPQANCNTSEVRDTRPQRNCNTSEMRDTRPQGNCNTSEVRDTRPQGNCNTSEVRDKRLQGNCNTSEVRDTARNNSSKFDSHLSLSPAETIQTVSRYAVVKDDADALRADNKVSRENSPAENSVSVIMNQARQQRAAQGFASATIDRLSKDIGVAEKKSDSARLSDSQSENSQGSLTEIKLERGNSVACDQPQAIEQPRTVPKHLSSRECLSNAREADACLARAGSRFYVKKRVIVGNTSKYIPLEGREVNDKSTHKWMVYVRGPPEDPCIDLFIRKVWFFLHPSYRPNDIVEVNKAPFHLTRRGWGEFPIRAQLHFVDSRNKRVDIIHELKLDRTYTGLQTLGAETVVDLELDRKSFEELGILIVSSSHESASVLASSTLVNTSELTSAKDDGELQSITEVKRKHTGNLTCGAQIPQVKKLKLEEATYGDFSPFSSLASTPVHSQASSRCTSPETTPVSISKFCDSTERALHEAVKIHPILDPKRNLVRFPYCARSLEQFWGWNIGKRRAAEWQRALALRCHVQKMTESRDLSTKDVVLWCRRYGYTPFHNPTVIKKSCYCKVCGSLVAREAESEDASMKEPAIHRECAEANDSFTSLSSSSNLLLSLEEKEETIPDVAQGSDDEKEIEVDVVSETPRKQAAMRKPQSPVYSLPLTVEEEWARNMCSDIGVKLQPVDFEGVKSHAVERMLWSACRQLIEDILRHAWASAADQSTSSASRLVVPCHVYRALDRLPTCDFLQNSYLGALEREEEQKIDQFTGCFHT